MLARIEPLDSSSGPRTIGPLRLSAYMHMLEGRLYQLTCLSIALSEPSEPSDRWLRHVGPHRLPYDACHHQALIDVRSTRQRVDVHSNWKERPVMPTNLRFD